LLELEFQQIKKDRKKLLSGLRDRELITVLSSLQVVWGNCFNLVQL